MPWSSGLPNGGFSVVKPWLPVPREHLALAAEDQEKDSQSVLQMFRRFAAWRKQHTALVTGDLALVQANEPILAFERRGDGERILCLFNFSNGTWHNRFQAHGTRSMVMALIAPDSNRIWYYFRLLAFGLGCHCATLELLQLLLPVRTTIVWKADLQFSRCIMEIITNMENIKVKPIYSFS
jgi:hypothetical protein